ncbi:hypothetical protein [Algoriphagus confluentis]|uniref:C-terminal domain of CHU protein family protein n=1 Tax=Algoriphagus confluentis TaxID=1697556 RepID=A0ABQ6PT00_9BACT|nr:hypothetical protein Aconfl_29510 [Algoriphagus confluentis]
MWSWLLILFAFIPSLEGRIGHSTEISPSDLTFRTDPLLVGPENLCIVFGGVVGTYSGGGDPDTDVYSWLVTDTQGQEIFNRSGGRQFETIKVSFNQTGRYSLSLNVRRNSAIIYSQTITVNVQQGPSLALLPDYLLCGDTPTEITAIDPSTPNFENYNFIWTDIGDNVVGTTNSIFVSQEGFYKIELFLNGTSGAQECLISGSTYVGPSLDFEPTVSKSVICQGESITLGSDTPLSGEWFLQSPGSSIVESLGTSFSVTLDPGKIQTPGVYTAKFRANDPEFQDCPSERKITFEVNETPKITIQILENPDNCAEPNGSFSITAINDLDSLVVVEAPLLELNVVSGQQIILDDLKPQLYTVAIYSNGCQFITLLDLESKEPPIVNPTTPDISLPAYTLTPETCSDSGVNLGAIAMAFAQGQVNGEYRILSPGVGLITQGTINDQDSLLIPVKGGRYLFELKIDGCTYPVEDFIIDSKPSVSFDVPGEITICQTFDLMPETTENLIFRLTYPDQTIRTISSGEAFSLTQGGEYTLRGSPADPNSTLCPREQKIQATLARDFSFGLSLYEEDCFGNQVYKADLTGLTAEEASIRWINSEGVIVGRNELFFSTAVGDYSLIVQPLQSGFCPKNPIFFTVEPPILQVDVNMEANKICPIPGTSTIQVSTNMDAVRQIEWIFFDDAGNRRSLPELEGQFEITVEETGNYEAVVYNRIGCEIGRNFILIENSDLLTPPDLEEVYGVCSKGKRGPALNPGGYAFYYWYFGEQLVSQDPIFTPREAGNYSLKVITEDGCEFFDSFRTYDACSFEVRMPTAMILGDPSKNFEVYLSEGVTEAELYIFNRGGNLIHFEKSMEIPFEQAFLEWDGVSFGQLVPLGTYVVKLKVRNPLYEYEEVITSSLLVIE